MELPASHEDIEEHESLSALALVEEREPMVLFKETVVLELLHEYFGSLATVFINVEAGQGVEVLGALAEAGESDVLGDLVEKAVHHLLPVGQVVNFLIVEHGLILEEVGPGRGGGR